MAAWEERGLRQDADDFGAFLVRLAAEHLEMEEAIERAIVRMVDVLLLRLRARRVLGADPLFSRLAERMRASRLGVDAAAAALAAAPARDRLHVDDLPTAVYVVFTSVVYVAYDLAVSGASEDDVLRARRELATMAVRYLVGPDPARP